MRALARPPASLQPRRPKVHFTYRGSIFIGRGSTTWDKSVARNIIRWMMWPQDPVLPSSQEEERRRQESPTRRTPKPAADGYRAVSTGSDTPSNSSASTNSSPSSNGSANGETKAGSI